MVVTSEVVEERPYEEILDQTCPSCRQTIAWDVEVCPHCGWQIKGKARPKRIEVKEGAAPTKRKGKRGNATAAGSIIALGAFALLSYQYFPPAALIAIFFMVIMVVLAATPAE